MLKFRNIDFYLRNVSKSVRYMKEKTVFEKIVKYWPLPHPETDASALCSQIFTNDAKKD